ncbi:hypothetical protein ABZT06_21185 [Streptomyces sp. NPDC005483]
MDWLPGGHPRELTTTVLDGFDDLVPMAGPPSTVAVRRSAG